MKYIRKHKAPPREYLNWCREMKGKNNEDYRCLQNPEKGILHNQLIAEQGNICAYTMKRIDKDISHIEHIKPESECRKDETGSDLYYTNLVACFPKDGMESKCRYGAQAKDSWWEEDGIHFVSPLHTRCQSLIQFNRKGEVLALGNNPDAINTISILKLDNDELTEERRRAISVFIEGKNGDSPMAKKFAETSISEVLKRRNDGSYFPFCMAIHYGLIEYIAYLEKISAKRRFIKNSAK